MAELPKDKPLVARLFCLVSANAGLWSASMIERGGMVKVRHPSILFIALILYSILAASLHHHSDLEVVAGCAICKFADDLSSGDKTALYPLLTPFFVLISVNSDSFECIFRIATIAVIARAPPVYIPS
jgi:hypothetical protein